MPNKCCWPIQEIKKSQFPFDRKAMVKIEIKKEKKIHHITYSWGHEHIKSNMLQGFSRYTYAN